MDEDNYALTANEVVRQNSAESITTDLTGAESKHNALDGDAQSRIAEQQALDQLRVAVETEKERASRAEDEVAELVRNAEYYRQSLEEQTLSAVEGLNKFSEVATKLDTSELATGRQVPENLIQLKADLDKHSTVLLEALQGIQKIGKDLQIINAASKVGEGSRDEQSGKSTTT